MAHGSKPKLFSSSYDDQRSPRFDRLDDSLVWAVAEAVHVSGEEAATPWRGHTSLGPGACSLGESINHLRGPRSSYWQAARSQIHSISLPSYARATSSRGQRTRRRRFLKSTALLNFSPNLCLQI